MQPRESPEKTPDSDKRMKKKLDKMMKDLVPAKPFSKKPFFTLGDSFT